MAGVSRARLARYVASELQDGADAHALTQQLAAYLVEHKRPHDAGFIIRDIAAELARSGAVGLVTVTTARPLEASQREHIQAFAARKMNVASVELDERVRPSLLGGVIIETPVARYDRSLQRGIEQLISVQEG